MYAKVLAIGEFRGLWLGGLLSRAGSQLARVALAVLAYERSGSAAVTTLVYAMTFVPALVGGPALGWLADRYPRREVTIACDVIRTVLIGAVALPGLPLPALCALVFASQLLDSPSRAARISLTPDVLPRELYQTGVAVHQLSDQVVTLLGFAGGGIVVALVGADTAILINAATFAAAAMLTLATVARRPAAAGKQPISLLGGLRLVAGHRALRSLLGLAMLSGFHVIPEAIAVPYAASFGLGTAEAGLLMAALPAGNVIGVFVLSRFLSEARRMALMAPMAVAASVPLVASAADPGYVPLLLLWTVCGVLTGYNVAANAEYVRIAPTQSRGQAVGLASSGMVAAQGLGILLGGLLVEAAGPEHGLAIAGAAGLVAGVPVLLAWNRATRSGPRDQPQNSSL
ncbi:MFS transporter [Nonomuraea mesophila]|uniref:MFS transporter n=1 Tax=Nonomuraea mesophila TaxID=2530382 RepID=A0A4R5FT28_9ACTN|nr:MFS transporter [Nonomuraea mesophila]TDE56570.1 MFS transporter [Nonomuraea mesophila]